MNPLLLAALAVFTLATTSARAGFIQGQVPEFSKGADQWDGRRSFTAGGIAVDPITGKVFISDITGHRVLRYPASVNTDAILANTTEAEAVLGQVDLFATGLGAGVSGLNTPLGLAFDSSGNLYVADSGNHRIVRFSDASIVASGTQIDGVLGQASASTNTAGNGPAQLNDPQSITIFGRFLAVADTGNQRVQVFHDFPNQFAGASVSQSYGTGSQGISSTAMNQPSGVAISSYGSALMPRLRLWVADRGNNRVLRFDELDGNPIINGRTYDKTADGVLGQTSFTINTRNDTPSANNLSALSVLTSGNRLYVGDNVFGRVLRFDNAGALANGAAANGVLGQVDFTSKGPGVAGNGVAFSGARLWTTAGTRAGRFDAPTSGGATPFADTVLTSSAVSTADNFHHSAEDLITRKFYLYAPASGGSIRRYASCVAFRVGLPAEFTLSLTTSAAGFTAGTGIGGLAAHDGHLTFSDTSKHRVLDIPNAATITTNNAAQYVLYGQPSSTAITPGINDAGLTRMNSPRAVCWAVSPTGATLCLFVADTGNHRVLRYFPASVGIADLFGDGLGVSGTTASRLNGPQGLAYDGKSGLLHVADTGNNRLLQFRAYTSGSAASFTPGPAVGVLGQPDFTSFTAGSGVGKLNAPDSIALTPNLLGNGSEIFIMDRGNNRIARCAYNNNILPPPPLFIDLTFNTFSPTNNQLYAYPSTRNLSIDYVGSLTMELSGPDHQRTLWVTGNQRVTWFQRRYTPTILSFTRAGTSSQMSFTKRPYFPYRIDLSSDLKFFEPWSTTEFFQSVDATGQMTDLRTDPRKFYRITELGITD